MRTTHLAVALAVAAAAAAPAALAHPGEDPGHGPKHDPANGPEYDRGDGPRHDRGDGPKHDPGHGAKHGPGDGKKHDPGHGKRRGPKGTNHLLHACVTADATETGVALRALGGNRHMRRALDADALTATIGESTLIRLVGRARHRPEGSVPKRAPRIGTYADLTTGDRVIVRFWAPRGTAADALPAAWRIIDRGPAKACAAPVEPAPPAPEEPGDDQTEGPPAL